MSKQNIQSTYNAILYNINNNTHTHTNVISNNRGKTEHNTYTMSCNVETYHTMKHDKVELSLNSTVLCNIEMQFDGTL